jgi:hypothetical protein
VAIVVRRLFTQATGSRPTDARRKPFHSRAIATTTAIMIARRNKIPIKGETLFVPFALEELWREFRIVSPTSDKTLPAAMM